MTTSPPPQPPAGWYPDPTGKPGEMYWDGEAWHRLIPDDPAKPKADGVRSGNNPAPGIPATPKADKTRSGNKLAALIIGGLLLIIAVIYFLAYPLGLVYKLQSPSSPSPGSQQSQSYQAGYNSGTSGLARNTYGEEFDTSDVAKSEQYACSVAFTGEQIRNASLTEDDYVRGCLQAFSDHPPAKKSGRG